MGAREKIIFSNAKQLHLTIRASSKSIVNVDEKVMHWEDIGHKTEEGLLLQSTQPTIHKRPRKLAQQPPPNNHGTSQGLISVGVFLVTFFFVFS